MPERVRFSPSPSGELHLGGARTALFNALTARHTGGCFVLRFEDTDAARSAVESEACIAEDLRWLGLVWDEGPDVGGGHGPYRQSQRDGLYAAAVARLAQAGAVYPCFCTPELLAQDRAADAAAHRPPRYPGRCRAIGREDAAVRVAAGETHAWRFAVPGRREIVVDDLVHGEVRFDSSTISDFVVARSGGGALYDLACAVDDAAMSITTVIRGDDHLPNTPRQVLLHEALEQACPRWAHVPLVVDEGGVPLSKSGGASGVARLRGEGHLPAAVVNHLALLGWSDPDGREVLSFDELAGVFDVSRVSPSPARHDPARLLRLGRLHWRRLAEDERASALTPFLPGSPSHEEALRVVRLLGDDLDTPGSVREMLDGAWERSEPDDGALAALEAPAASAAVTCALAALASSRTVPFSDTLRSALRDDGLAPREAMPAIRAALTGHAHGPRIEVLVDLMGAAEAEMRLEAALHSIDSGAGRC